MTAIVDDSVPLTAVADDSVPQQKQKNVIILKKLSISYCKIWKGVIKHDVQEVSSLLKLTESTGSDMEVRRLRDFSVEITRVVRVTSN